ACPERRRDDFFNRCRAGFRRIARIPECGRAPGDAFFKTVRHGSRCRVRWSAHHIIIVDLAFDRVDGARAHGVVTDSTPGSRVPFRTRDSALRLSTHRCVIVVGLRMTSARLGNDTNETNAQVILEVAKAVSAHLDLSDVLEALIATLKPLIAFDAVGVGVLEGEEIRLHSVYIEGL